MKQVLIEPKLADFGGFWEGLPPFGRRLGLGVW